LKNIFGLKFSASKSVTEISTSENTPLAELDTLKSELASLETQLIEKRISREQFELSSNQLKERILNAELRAYSLARKDDALARQLRPRIYNEPIVQQVCDHFVYGSKKPLMPQFDADRAPKYYIDPESAKTSVDNSILERMVDTRILTSTLYEKALLCPSCKTPTNVFARFKCPQCGSINIAINRMIEHLSCGTIHQEQTFRSGKDMICPTCKKTLQKNDEQRLIGLVCSCNKCQAHFEDPSQSFFCRACETDFTLTSGIMTEIYTYNLNEQILSEVRSNLGIPVIAQSLESNGYQLTIPGVLAGEAKELQFSIVARKDVKIITIDLFMSDKPIEVEPVLSLYVKMLECATTLPTLAVLAAVPRLSRKAQEVALEHNILVAEGSTPHELAQRIIQAAEGAVGKGA